MRKRAQAFMILVIVLGALCFLVCMEYRRAALWDYVRAHAMFLASMLILSALTRSLPLYLRNEQAFDLSVVSTVAIYLCGGGRLAIIIYVMSTLITFEKAADGTVRSVYNTDVKKSLFNVANIVLSIAFPALLCRWLGIAEVGVALPAVLPKAIVFSVGTYVVNALLTMTLFCLMGIAAWRDCLKQVLGLMPNVLAAMPIGILLAFVYGMDNGVWLVLLMLFPLLLARYAWKLYLDAQKQQMRLIQAIISAMEAKDEYTEGHSRRVHDYALQIGQAMGMKGKALETLGVGALLHDVGKIGIDDSILCKPGRLDDEEWQIMRSHPEIGVRIVKDLGFPAEVLEIIRSHHQRYDGGGYPPMEAGGTPGMYTMIMAVADAYDAMTSDRAYRKHFSQEKAVGILEEGSGTQFHPAVVEAFVRALEEKKA